MRLHTPVLASAVGLSRLTSTIVLTLKIIATCRLELGEIPMLSDNQRANYGSMIF